ncbi:hypothetical protein OIE13_05970 [Streptosporangium sp. NBC_01810]|uniref:hypothetical protein n=1 Tax=Streptosporangium sp. NBC_01810 TaxID=2975951 RepID=UPI002DDB13E5|nr:hypothetical protein [Streptosporangium sp. NBC_01810]WSA27420.1 hypothetical protein OIE13_05970 [Streptosporangium sp. NBC_01810]
MTWRYTGDMPATYPAYLAIGEDGQVQTLVAEPGKTYEIQPAEGTETVTPSEKEGGKPTVTKLPVPPEGPWERVKTTTSSSDKGKE